MKRSNRLTFSALTIMLATSQLAYTNTAAPSSAQKKHIILFVWDGLRPDSITEKDTPNLYHLKKQGTWFNDNHSSYPTFTMMNAASFATGNLAGKTGFYGNTLWDPRATGNDAEGEKANFSKPIFTEDYKILKDMDRPQNNDPTLFSSTLFSKAHEKGLTTATIGKSGAAFIQNYRENAKLNGIILDEKHAYPLAFAKALEDDGYPLPKYSPLDFSKGHLTLNFDNGDPTAFGKVETLKVISGGALGQEDDYMYPDNVTPNPNATNVSPYSKSNAYLMQTYLDKILADKAPDLSVVWLRNPDTTEHNYGVGSPSYFTALHDQDKLLGKLLAKLKSLHLSDTTDILIASDHSHSNVSGPLQQYPLRFIHNSMVSVPDTNGYSTSGDFRPADLLSKAGFLAYDGQGCEYDPVLSGIKANGELNYRIHVDRSGKVCGQTVKINDSYGHRSQTIGHLYTTPAYRIPTLLPKDGIIVAGNGGSTYLYVVNHDPILVKKVVRFLQSRQEFGAVFIDDRYGEINGTLPMSVVKIRNPQGRNPDIIVGSSFNEKTTIRGSKGIEFNSSGTDRGMHGSFSHVDVHNTLIAVGPDFKAHYVDTLPTGNIDVAPTIAYLLQIDLPNTDGRPLLESFKKGLPETSYSVLNVKIKPSQPAIGLTYHLATNPFGKDTDPSKTKYTIELDSKLLFVNGKSYPYFDRAKEIHF